MFPLPNLNYCDSLFFCLRCEYVRDVHGFWRTVGEKFLVDRTRSDRRARIDWSHFTQFHARKTNRDELCVQDLVVG